jgi:threonine dehydrogenase-like Zn-dependent dehydrogenase
VKAARLRGPSDLVVEDVRDPVVGRGEVRVRVGGVGLCGSDLAVYTGKWTAPSYPWIPGHEAFGRIEAVGAGVAAERVGELVVIEPNIACYACPSCATGRTSACLRRQSIGMNRQGALAEYLIVPDAYAWPIDGPAERDLACVEPLAVVEAALRRLGGPVPASALVIGVGSQGLLMTLSLVGRGAAVSVHDVSAARIGHAVTLGGRPVVADDEALKVDLVVDTVGSTSSTEVALRHVVTGGTILLLGLDASPLGLTAQTIVRRQLVVRGSLTYDHPVDFASTVDRVGRGLVTPGVVVTDEYTLEEAPLAFERAAGAAGKTWIRIGGSGAR